MAFNGSGTFALYTPGNPVVTGTTIASSWANNTLTDIATGLTNCITKDGQSTPSADIPMGANKITGLASGTAATDAANIANIVARTGQYVATVGGTADVITLTPSPAIAAYAAGQQFSFIVSGANTGAVTVNVNALGAKAITKNGATALAAGDLAANALALIEYDGTQFQVISVSGAAKSGTVTGSGLTMATARLLGRTTASTGAIEEITVGASLTLSAGSLSGTAASDTQAGVIEVAIQSEMEAGSSTTLAVTPGRQQFHPSAAKGWASADAAGTINASYNLTSITDVDLGQITFTWATDFSSANYAAVSDSFLAGAVSNSRVLGQAAGTTDLAVTNAAGSAADPTAYFIAAFGDQA